MSFALTHLIGFGAGGVDPTGFTFGASTFDSANATTYTFTGMGIGTNGTGRQVVVCIGGSGTTAPRSVSSVTVGGISASLVIANQHSGGTDYTSEMWVASVPTGTTADVVVTWSGAMDIMSVATFSIVSCAVGASATGQTETDAGNVSMAVPANGIIIGYTSTNSATPGVTWTANITESFDEQVTAVSYSHSGAAAQKSGSTENYNADWGSAGSRLMTVFAAWAAA